MFRSFFFQAAVNPINRSCTSRSSLLLAYTRSSNIAAHPRKKGRKWWSDCQFRMVLMDRATYLWSLPVSVSRGTNGWHLSMTFAEDPCCWLWMKWFCWWMLCLGMGAMVWLSLDADLRHSKTFPYWRRILPQCSRAKTKLKWKCWEVNVGRSFGLYLHVCVSKYVPNHT